MGRITVLAYSSSRSPAKQHPLANLSSQPWTPAVATTSVPHRRHPHCLPTQLPIMLLQTRMEDHILMHGNTRAIMARIVPRKDTEVLLRRNRHMVLYLANKEPFHPATCQTILPVALQTPA